MQTVRLPLREYVKYLTVRDHWLSQREHGTPFYGNSWTPFLTHEAMRDHVGRMSFVEDLVEEDGPLGVLSRKLTKVFFGPPATVTRLHHDTYSLHAWLSQVRGRKQFVLYPKSQAHLLHAGEGECAGECAGEGAGAGEGTCCDAAQSWFDPTAPDYRRFPRARRATPHVAVLEEGDTLFCPAGWFHYAIALSPSITLMRNFFNSANADRFVEGWNAAHSLQTQPQPQPQPQHRPQHRPPQPPQPQPQHVEEVRSILEGAPEGAMELSAFGPLLSSAVREQVSLAGGLKNMLREWVREGSKIFQLVKTVEDANGRLLARAIDGVRLRRRK
uniref:JmjC domain-containing protein n=1 Tax=Emiliania huxleyi TaxID=2903 RepID=A0A6V2U9A0_EMIHU